MMLYDKQHGPPGGHRYRNIKQRNGTQWPLAQLSIPWCTYHKDTSETINIIRVAGRGCKRMNQLSRWISITVPASKATSGDPKFQGAGAQAATNAQSQPALHSVAYIKRLRLRFQTHRQKAPFLTSMISWIRRNRKEKQSSWLHSLTPTYSHGNVPMQPRGTEETQSLLLLYPSDALIDLESSIRSEL
jgi:hypothetical protein